MKFIRIKDVKDLKQGDSIAISNSELEREECTSLLFGEASCVETDSKGKTIGVNMYIKDAFIKDGIKITNNTIKIQNVYKVAKENEKEEVTSNAEVVLLRALRKAEKLNKRLETILAKRFGVTKETLDMNFKTARKSSINKFITYKAIEDNMPCVDKTGKLRTLYTTAKFSSDGKNSIKCELTIHKSKLLKEYILTTEAVAICHQEDTFSKEAGELIAYNKAYAKAICNLH